MNKLINLVNEDGIIMLVADFKEKTVRTDCGVFYYDYDISFDDFIKFAHLIENVCKDFKE